LRPSERPGRFGRHLLSLLTYLRARRRLLEVGRLTCSIELLGEALLLSLLCGPIDGVRHRQPVVLDSKPPRHTHRNQQEQDQHRKDLLPPPV
jgi:hypothetical protein